MDNYVFKYIGFKSLNKDQSNYLNSANSLIGDKLIIEMLSDMTVLIKNKFNQDIGTIDKNNSHDIILSINKGLKYSAYLSFVAYNHSTNPYHWGEILFVAYPNKDSEFFEIFCSKIEAKLSQGYRPDVKLDKFNIGKIISSKGSWTPNKTKAFPKMEEGNAIVKKKKSMLDKTIEQGRNKNPGCYVASIVFIAMIAAGLLLIVLSLSGIL